MSTVKGREKWWFGEISVGCSATPIDGYTGPKKHLQVSVHAVQYAVTGQLLS